MSRSLFIHFSSKHMNYEELLMTAREGEREERGSVCRELDGLLDIFSSFASSQSVSLLSQESFFLF